MKEPPDPNEFRDNPTAIAAYLTEALGKNDLPTFVRAIGHVMRAQNVVALAKQVGLRREGLYRMFDGESEPKLAHTLKVLDGLGVRLVVQPFDPPRIKPPLPKLGRPPKSPKPAEVLPARYRLAKRRKQGQQKAPDNAGA